MRKIPVTIISGFLGSGKTTLLNQLIKKYRDKKFAIIENEIGDIGIDGALIVGDTGQIYELSNGCICCSINSGFNDTVKELLNSQADFNHLLVETTGIADPDSIIHAFLAEGEIQDNFILDSVIVVADAVNLEDMLDEIPEIRKQLALADIVLLNKCDGISSDYRDTLIALISSINPGAKVLSTSFSSVDDTDFLDQFAFNVAQTEKTVSEFRNNTAPPLATLLHRLKLGGDRKLIHDISTVAIAIPGSFAIESFNFWMQNYLYFNNKTVYRVKGIMSMAEVENKVVFQAVRGDFMIEEGSAWEGENRYCKLIFIGKNLNREQLEQNLQQLVVRCN